MYDIKMKETNIILFGTILMALYLSTSSALEIFNVTDPEEFVQVDIDGEKIYMTKHLIDKLKSEKDTWHWLPWQRLRIEYVDNIAREIESGNSIDSFPDGLFTDEQLRKGGFILYILFGIYAFTLLAVVCNDYFIPCVELICEDLKIPENVAAATFMSVATSCPEFFVNMISTFLTKSDMGIGTIVGSAIFNALGVGAIGSLAAIRPLAIGIRPVTRDVLIYMVNVSVLVAIVWDGQVDWYEAVVLAVLYVSYFILMFNSMRLFGILDKLLYKCCNKSTSSNEDIVVVTSNEIEDGIDNKGYNEEPIIVSPMSNSEKTSQVIEKVDPDPVKPKKSMFVYPKHKTIWQQLVWLYLWPLRVILGFTIPSPVHHRRWYPLAFFMCIVWIGCNSYCVTWSMTVLGHVLTIPDSVMGMTFLAFGGCLPEAFSIYIMARRGEGGIGVSNALGANSLAILFALGIPWLIKILVNIVQGATVTAVLINSSGIDFVVGSLLVAVSCLWLTLFFAKFTLRKSVGIILCSFYVIFITFAILVEMGIILDRCVIEGC